MRTMEFVAVACLLWVLPAFAAPAIQVGIAAKKEVVQHLESGERVRKLVAANEMAPGELLMYEVSIHNSGDESATNLVIDDPIPEGTTYVAGSATELGQLLFSIDQGKTFLRPMLLTYEVRDASGTVTKKTAAPEEYTHIRWVIPSVAAGETRIVHFQVLVQK